LVKGVFKVNESQGFQQHTEALNNRYLELVEIICKANHPLSIATQDPQMINAVIKSNLLANPNTEIEMLHGVTPLVLKNIKEKGYQTRVYLVYGTQWFLHLCHRIAEYPPNIFQSVSDCLHPVNRKDDYYF
jgi:proline dehydrogenase